MQGLHLTADLEGCDPARTPMVDVDALRRLCAAAAAQAGLTVVGECFHRFPVPGGITGVLLLAESHLAVHTWPEVGRVTVDVFVCNLRADNAARAEAAMASVVAAFAPRRATHQRLQRGESVPD